MRRRTFDEYITPRPKPRGLDVVVTLRHFALVTYTIDPEILRRRLPPRLSPLTLRLGDSSSALLSVVLFMNTDFRSAVFPSPALDIAQINYRAYVVDNVTGDHAIWFLGTLLDGWAYAVPRFLWRMPWHKGPIEMHWNRNDTTERYDSYIVTSGSEWSPVWLELTETDSPTSSQHPSVPRFGSSSADATTIDLPGFPDVETGLVCLTHATKGFYRRADGQIGLNRVWHPRIIVRPARLVEAAFPLLHRQGLVPRSEQHAPYGVFIASEVGFLSHLPPRIVPPSSDFPGQESP